MTLLGPWCAEAALGFCERDLDVKRLIRYAQAGTVALVAVAGLSGLSQSAPTSNVRVAGALPSIRAAQWSRPTGVVRLANCGDMDREAYGPMFGHWSRTYRGECGHMAGTHKPRIGVAWAVADFSDGEACVQARGYRWRDGKPYWVSLGCGTSGSGVVHWGKSGGYAATMSITAVKVKSLMYPLGVPIYFTD